MLSCWQFNPDKRPTAGQVVKFLSRDEEDEEEEEEEEEETSVGSESCIIPTMKQIAQVSSSWGH